MSDAMYHGLTWTISLWTFTALLLWQLRYAASMPRPIYVKSCACGAHWWIRRLYFFWRHLDASPFNDKLQDQWTIWMFEFRDVLKLSTKEQAEMGFPQGPLWEDGRAMWSRSKWQRSPHSASYCLRCARHGL